MVSTESDDFEKYDSITTESIEIPAGPGVTATATTEVYSGNGPLRVISVKSNRRIATAAQTERIALDEQARVDEMSALTAEGKTIPDAMKIPITLESRGYRGSSPESHYNVHKYIKEGEVYYTLDVDSGGLVRVLNPPAELPELFERLAEYNLAQEDNDFIRLTPNEIARLQGA